MKVIPSDKELQILALVATERTGRDIAREFEKRTGKAIAFGTLYVTLRRLKEAGWVEVTRETADGDERVKYYRIRAKGAAALERGREHHAALSIFAAEGSPE